MVSVPWLLWTLLQCTWGADTSLGSDCISFRYIARSGVAGSPGSSVWFFEEPPYCFRSWLYRFTFPPTVNNSSLSSKWGMLTLMPYYCRTHSSYSNLSFIWKMSFAVSFQNSDSSSNLGSCIASSDPVSLISFNLEQFLCCFFPDQWYFWRI